MHKANPLRNTPVVTLILILINLAVFVYEIFSGNISEKIIRRFSLIPYDFVNLFGLCRFLRLFSSLFLHGNFPHLAGNMLYLWVFGNNVERNLGYFRFLVLYLFCGVTAHLIYILTQYRSVTPVIGASGAISGIIGIYFVLLAKKEFPKTFGSFCSLLRRKIPVLLFLIIWVFLGLLSSGKGVVYSGHLGGFFAGAIFAVLLPKTKYSDVKRG